MKPSDWIWLYHVTLQEFIPDIGREGLVPIKHAFLEPDEVAIFVEPSVEGVQPYLEPNSAILRFLSPGYGETEWGDYVVYGGSQYENQIPDAPFVGAPGTRGAIPPEELEILTAEGWVPLVEAIT